MSLKPGDVVFVALYTGYGKSVAESVVWRHATYLVAGRYWPTYRIVLAPENEGIEWSRPGLALAAFKTAVALSAE